MPVLNQVRRDLFFLSSGRGQFGDKFSCCLQVTRELTPPSRMVRLSDVQSNALLADGFELALSAVRRDL